MSLPLDRGCGIGQRSRKTDASSPVGEEREQAHCRPGRLRPGRRRRRGQGSARVGQGGQRASALPSGTTTVRHSWPSGSPPNRLRVRSAEVGVSNTSRRARHDSPGTVRTASRARVRAARGRPSVCAGQRSRRPGAPRRLSTWLGLLGPDRAPRRDGHGLPRRDQRAPVGARVRHGRRHGAGRSPRRIAADGRRHGSVRLRPPWACRG